MEGPLDGVDFLFQEQECGGALLEARRAGLAAAADQVLPDFESRLGNCDGIWFLVCGSKRLVQCLAEFENRLVGDAVCA